VLHIVRGAKVIDLFVSEVAATVRDKRIRNRKVVEDAVERISRGFGTACSFQFRCPHKMRKYINVEADVLEAALSEWE
jgi:hypothetical protein